MQCHMTQLVALYVHVLQSYHCILFVVAHIFTLCWCSSRMWISSKPNSVFLLTFIYSFSISFLGITFQMTIPQNLISAEVIDKLSNISLPLLLSLKQWYPTASTMRFIMDLSWRSSLIMHQNLIFFCMVIHCWRNREEKLK